MTSRKVKPEVMAGEKIKIKLLDHSWEIEPLGFGAGCLFMSRGSAIEDEISQAKDRQEQIQKSFRLLPQILEMVFQVLGISAEEREQLDKEFGQNLLKAAEDAMEAFRAISASLDPTIAAQMKPNGRTALSGAEH